jgi:hypothetical protein
LRAVVREKRESMRKVNFLEQSCQSQLTPNLENAPVEGLEKVRNPEPAGLRLAGEIFMSARGGKADLAVTSADF